MSQSFRNILLYICTLSYATIDDNLNNQDATTSYRFFIVLILLCSLNIWKTWSQKSVLRIYFLGTITVSESKLMVYSD